MAKVQLEWDDVSGDEDLFVIERKRLGVDPDFVLRATVPADFIMFVDDGVIVGEEYTYRVKARNLAGDSDYSNEATILVESGAPEAPANLTAVQI